MESSLLAMLQEVHWTLSQKSYMDSKKSPQTNNLTQSYGLSKFAILYGLVLSQWLARLKLLCCLMEELHETWCIWTSIPPISSLERNLREFRPFLCFARLGFVVCLSKTWHFSFFSSLGLIFLFCFVYKGLDFASSSYTLCLMARPSCLFVGMLVEFFIALDLIGVNLQYFTLSLFVSLNICFLSPLERIGHPCLHPCLARLFTSFLLTLFCHHLISLTVLNF